MSADSSMFISPSGATGPQLSRPESLIIGNLTLPDIVEARLTDIMAYRLLAIGQHRAARYDAKGGISSFHQKIQESYGKSWKEWEAAQIAHEARHNLQPYGTRLAFANELASLERDLKAAERASQLYESDTPLARKDLQTLEVLASECVAFANRSKGLKAFGPVKLLRGDTPEVLQAALKDAAALIHKTERAWPLFETALNGVEAELAEKAKLPVVEIHQKLTPERSLREFPVEMVVGLFWPETSTRHETGPGSAFWLHQEDSLAVLLALHKDAILAHFRQQLEARYEAAKAEGVLVLGAAERKKALKDAKAARLATERRLSELFWQGRETASAVLTYESDPRAVLGVE